MLLNLDIVELKKLNAIVIKKIEEYLNKYEEANCYNGNAQAIVHLIISIYEKEKSLKKNETGGGDNFGKKMNFRRNIGYNNFHTSRRFFIIYFRTNHLHKHDD